MPEPTVRNPRAEATALLPEGHEARVLEPSPPANKDPDFFADDPTDPAGADGHVFSPTGDGDHTWDELVDADASFGDYIRDHWLGNYKRLQPLPDTFAATRDALHHVAFFAIAPKRHSVNGKLGLRYTHGGFGTPFYDDDEQVRVEGNLLVVQSANSVRSTELTSVGDAAEFLGVEYAEVWFEGMHDPLKPGDPDAALDVDPAASRAVGDWFGFATAVLEQVRRSDGAADVSRVQLWPEHFDLAAELGDADAGQRASYGASPGDDAHPEPYLYVAAWDDVDRENKYWNDTTFNGASLSYQELLAADDQFATALDFYRRGYEILTTER